MKYLAIITLFIVGFSFNEASAQDYLFRVLANKGINQIVKAGSSSANQLKTGSKLYSGDQIIAAAGAYIGLVYKTGKTIEIKTPGTYNLEDLAGKLKGTSSAASRYMNFVMNKLNENETDVHSDYRKNLHATGAVSRGTKGELALLMMSTETPSKVLGDKTVIRWEGGLENDSYIVTVKDIFGDVLFETESSDTKIELDFTSKQLKSTSIFLVDVRSATKKKIKSEAYGIQKLSASETSLQTSLDELTQQLSEGSSINNLIYASFYEEKSLLLDAMSKYEAAVNENPDVEDYQTIYNQFMGVDDIAGE